MLVGEEPIVIANVHESEVFVTCTFSLSELKIAQEANKVSSSKLLEFSNLHQSHLINWNQ